jgi:hypothetical protein
LLAVLRAMFTKNRTQLTSEQVVQELLADPDSQWHEYRGRGPITKNQVADCCETMIFVLSSFIRLSKRVLLIYLSHLLGVAYSSRAGLTRPLRDRFCQVHFAFH